MGACAALAALAVLTTVSSDPAREFDYLAVAGHVVSTTHGLRLTVRLPSDLVALGETHFRESYGGPAFNVSATAFAGDSVLVAIHAEAHSDGSGGLDYSDLAPDTVAGIPLHSRIDCFDLREESDADIEGNGFLRFLRDRGFDFQRALVLERLFLTGHEGRFEVVLSYGLEAPGCGEDGVARPLSEAIRRESRATFGSLTRP